MRALAFLALLLATAAQAQQRQPANVSTLPQSSPQEFDLLDKTGAWVPFGTAAGGAFSGLGREINLASFGAKCDGAADDTAAIQAWLAKAAARVKLVGMPGQCMFTSALTIPATDDLIVDFQGGVLHYRGASTTISLLSIGSMASNCLAHRVAIRNFSMYSDTVMTAGDAFYAGTICVLVMEQTYLGHVWLPNNFYNGCHFVGMNQFYVKNYSCRGSNAGEIDNGEDTAHGGAQSTDMYHYNGALSNSGIGLLIAGNCGGCIWYTTDIVNNTNYNVLIDQSQTPSLPNRQIIFGPGTAATDGTPGSGVRISDPGTPGAPGPGRGGNQFFCLNCWMSTATNDCLVIDAGVSWEIHLVGMRMENCGRNGINNASANSHLIIDGGAIAQNGTGINNTATLPWVQFLTYPSMYGNVLNDAAGLKPTIASGCGGTGAVVSRGDDYTYQIQWGSTAGQTTCTVNFGSFHPNSAIWTDVSIVGTNTTGNLVAGGGAVSQTFSFQVALSSGNLVRVRNAGMGF
jgi:hypothetical protein